MYKILSHCVGVHRGIVNLLFLSHCQYNLSSHQNGKYGNRKVYMSTRTLQSYAIVVGAIEQKSWLKVQEGSRTYWRFVCNCTKRKAVCVFYDCRNTPKHCALRALFWLLVPLLSRTVLTPRATSYNRHLLVWNDPLPITQHFMFWNMPHSSYFSEFLFRRKNVLMPITQCHLNATW